MRAVAIVVALGLVLVAVGVYLKTFAGWRRTHQAIIGGLTVLYGMWLALGTGTMLKLIVPGFGSIALGSAAGIGVGLLTYLAVGVVGVATGGVGIAMGKVGMMIIGGLIGGIGGAAGSFGLVRVPLISPALWVPVIVVGVYLLIGAYRRKRLTRAAPSMLPGAPDA